MSLLAQLNEKRVKLKPTSTIITLPTGERFLERSSTEATLIKLENSPFGFVEDKKPDKLPAEILPYFLYLGSQDAVSQENIDNYKFTHILSIGINANICDIGLIKHKFLPMLDLPETELFTGNTLNEALQFIDDAHTTNGRILVHCNAGVSRSASIVIAYLINRNSLGFEEAYNLVKSKRECIQPNVGFMRQLRNFHP